MDSSTAAKTPFRFAISATFNAEPLEAVLRFWAAELEVAAEVRFAPFNQPLQTLLDPTGVFAQNHDGVNALLVRLEDLGQLENRPQLEANVRELAAAARTTAGGMAVPLLFVLCPPSHMRPEDLERWLEANLSDAPGVHYVSFEELLRLYPVADYHNPLGEKLGGIPYTDLFFAGLGTALFRRAHALTKPPYKVIALDCDNTLWEGICGEDGPTGVRLDSGRRGLHDFMLGQREAGMLLTMVSKNNEEDVRETFAKNPEMPLALRHFVGWRINWESKARNLSDLAAELNLGLDSFVFVDDNPRECGEVEDTLPETLALVLPEDAAEIPNFLNHVWAFDHPVVTEEDRQRSALYQQSQEFGRALRGAESLAHFYETLQLQVRFAAMDAGRVARTAQLTQRTNQFNTTAIRRTEAEMRSLVAHRDWVVMTVDATDRFGDYGQVGVMILRKAPPALEVESLLLSCRTLGRGVEHQMLQWAGQYAEANGFTRVYVPLNLTAKNAPARLFLESIGQGQETEQGLMFSFGAGQLRGLDVRPQPSATAARPSPGRKSSEGRRYVDYARIARDLSHPRQVLERMRSKADLTAPLVGGTPTERGLARIWGELLELKAVALDDNFFDLGGHSLQAVLLLLRVKEAFGVVLEIDDVYSGTATLRSIAALIDARQLETANPEEYAALLAEVEGMTDEEIRALLAAEGD